MQHRFALCCYVYSSVHALSNIIKLIEGLYYITKPEVNCHDDRVFIA